MWDLLHIIMPNLYHIAIFVKPQQWPTPSESIAIYCVRKLVSLYHIVTYNQTIARKLEFAVWKKRNNLHLKLSSWITQDVKTNYRHRFIGNDCFDAKQLWILASRSNYFDTLICIWISLESAARALCEYFFIFSQCYIILINWVQVSLGV